MTAGAAHPGEPSGTDGGGAGGIPAAAGTGWVLGVDSGGSGLRIALARASTEVGSEASGAPGAAGAPGAGAEGAPRAHGTASSAEPVRTGPRGIDPEHLLGQLLPAARRLLAEAGADGVRAVCVGASGMASLGGALRAELPGALAAEFGTCRLALAADAVTAYAGALGVRPGVVVAAGTGMVAVGTDLRGWRRADGWGHLLGDGGGGAWIGRAGLTAALRAHDGRAGGSAALRARAEAVFGAPLDGLPGQVYPRTDRPAVLASFAPEVAACADDGDPVARAVLEEAAAEIAATASAACPPVSDSAVALTGGLLRLGAPLLAPLERELAARLPAGARTCEAAGDPLSGALLIADRLARGSLALPADQALLTVT